MDAEDLYGLPLDQFVAQRGALAKALRADGKRDEAKTVSALRKPSVAAWAVNQLVRTQAKAFDRLLAAGDELVEVQAGVLAGDRDPTELREAVASQRAAVEQLLEAAGGLLSSEGHDLSPAVLDRVADTLRAAALDPEAREQVQAAQLERELRHVGLGAGGLVSAPAESQAKSRPKSRTKSTPTSKPKRTEPKRAEPKRAEPKRAEPKRAKPRPAEPKPAEPAASRADAKQAARDHQEARRTARHAEADSRRAAERAQRALEVAQECRDKAAEALAEADRAVAEAELTAQRTADAHREAQQAFEAL